METCLQEVLSQMGFSSLTKLIPRLITQNPTYNYFLSFLPDQTQGAVGVGRGPSEDNTLFLSISDSPETGGRNGINIPWQQEISCGSYMLLATSCIALTLCYLPVRLHSR